MILRTVRLFFVCLWGNAGRWGRVFQRKKRPGRHPPPASARASHFFAAYPAAASSVRIVRFSFSPGFFSAPRGPFPERSAAVSRRLPRFNTKKARGNRLRPQTVKKLGRAREGRSPFELSIVPSGVYGGHGAIFAPENPIFQRKNRFLAVSAPEKSLIFSGDW